MADTLRYVDDSLPGITRKRIGKYWQYFDTRGQRITRRVEIERLNAIALPPAYTDAWFCPKADGHLQAIGWDARGRKQYRYHTKFRNARDADKYALCSDFGVALPVIRKHVEQDLAKRGTQRATIIAAIVRLLDRGRVRIGNEVYARSNKSYGATTLRKSHARVKGQSVSLEYIGKSGKAQTVGLDDKRLARVVRRCLDQSESNLFEYLDATGERHAVTSSDVNAYLREVSRCDFTAKHFRTWGASVITLDTFLADDQPLSIKAVLQPVATALGNTPAIARKSYVHPAVIALVETPEKVQRLRRKIPRNRKYLTSTELVLLKLLKTRRKAITQPREKAES
jgi:DNA topoisomerase I